MPCFVLISGCSGGGKSTLLAELGRRGHATVEEPGRRVVRAELARGGEALPWSDPAAFARRAMALALEDRQALAGREGQIFFDRGLVDAAAFLEHLTGEPALAPLRDIHRYHHRVFLTPPWSDLFQGDAERRHGFGSAVAEYERLLDAYPALGYEIVELPRIPVGERADFILAALAQSSTGTV